MDQGGVGERHVIGHAADGRGDHLVAHFATTLRNAGLASNR